MEVVITNIVKTAQGSTLTIAVEGRLDTTTSPALTKAVEESIEDVKELVFDFAKLEYISSSGLRVLLSAQKAMNSKGKMIVKNVSEIVMEIFDITGFVDILTIE